MSNFKVDNLEVNTINGNSISSLGGSGSAGATMTEYNSINTSSIQGTDFPEKVTINTDIVDVTKLGKVIWSMDDSNVTAINGDASYNDKWHHQGIKGEFIFDNLESKAIFRVDLSTWCGSGYEGVSKFAIYGSNVALDDNNHSSWQLIGEFTHSESDGVLSSHTFKPMNVRFIKYVGIEYISGNGGDNFNEVDIKFFVGGTTTIPAKLTITEDTQIRKINVTTKNLDGKLTVGDTVFEGTKVDTSGATKLETFRVDRIFNEGDSTGYSAFNLHFFDKEGNLIEDMVDNIEVVNYEYIYKSSSDGDTYRLYWGFNIGDTTDYHNNGLFNNNSENGFTIYKLKTPTEISKIVANPIYTTYNKGNIKLTLNNTEHDSFKANISEPIEFTLGPSIPTITKEIQLDSTTIDMELDGTLDSVNYETFSGQDIDALSLVIDFITGDSTKQTEVINKLNKLKGE